MRSSSASRALLLASAALACATLSLTPRSEAQAGELDALLRRFASIERMSCRFREEKRIALLTTPIVSEGTIHYARPDRMARRVTSPSPQVLLLEGSRLQMGESGRVETIDLDAQPVVRSFVDGIVLLLRGDRAGLERTYRATYAGGAEGWTLVLRPRSSPLDRFLREMRFEGDASGLRRMLMEEVSGDTTTTVFTDADMTARWSATEERRIFSM